MMVRKLITPIILMLHGFVLKSKGLYLRPTCIFMLYVRLAYSCSRKNVAALWYTDTKRYTTIYY